MCPNADAGPVIGNVFDAYLSSAAAQPVPGTPRARVEFRENERAEPTGLSPTRSAFTPSRGEQIGGAETIGGGENGSANVADKQPDSGAPCPQGPDDLRSIGEKRAGILCAVFEAAARQPDTPSMGGAPPTVLVHININDLRLGRGAGWIDGIDGPITPQQVDTLMDAGGYQSALFGQQGQLLNLGRSRRFFTNAQRRALAARDGGCVIPGCTVPAHHAQAHHVIPWRNGGATTIDNAVLLCNAAHSSIETSGWNIRMVRGRPWIRGPLILDPCQMWRPAAQNRAAIPAEKPNWQK